MKKIIVISVFLIGIGYFAVFPGTTTSLGSNFEFVDNGYDFWRYIVNDKGVVVPVKVVEYNVDSNYIIAVRVVIDLYECYDINAEEHAPQNSVELPVIPRHKLQYWLIDKNKYVSYFSSNKSKIEEMLKHYKSFLKFNQKSYQDDIDMKIESGELDESMKCNLTNDPQKNHTVIQVINLDEEY